MCGKVPKEGRHQLPHLSQRSDRRVFTTTNFVRRRPVRHDVVVRAVIAPDSRAPGALSYVFGSL